MKARTQFQPAYLVLKDGTTFPGTSFGYESSVAGEVVFNTGMVGYPESFTDPSYRGQLLTLTYPLIGNYGIPENITENAINRHFESEQIHISGLIVSDYSTMHHHWNAALPLADWLKRNNIPALTGIDTRSLTQKLREHGTMPGKIIIDRDTIEFSDPNERNLVAEVSRFEPYRIGKGKRRILLVDCGCKNNIIRSFLKYDVELLRVPWDADIEQYEYDGLFISNGPGNPKLCEPTIAGLQKALKRKQPIFGICLGHQLLARAVGAETYKLKYGHRGQNQPVKAVNSNACYITSQNHSFAVDASTLPHEWKPLFTNLNDGTNEGMIHTSGRYMSVQFHPESSPGPSDTSWLFDKFIGMMK